MTSYTALVLLYCAIIAYWVFRSDRATRKLSSQPWERLVDDLASVRYSDIARASDQYGFYKESGSEEGFDDLPTSLGGKESIRRIKKNTRILLNLACYCERWSPECSKHTVGEMRTHEMKLRRALAKYKVWVIGLALLDIQKNDRRASRYLAEISYSYCAMTNSLLSLYKETHIARYPQLRAACS